VTRFLPDGRAVSAQLDPGLPDPAATRRIVFSLDRARISASGEDVLVAVRWSDNSVRAHRLEFHQGTFHPAWTTLVEPGADLLAIGIIGGGFDNFHQGDRTAFVYLDVDSTGAAYVVVPSTPEVLAAHDALFGEHLLAGADPDHFDYGVSIITGLSPEGTRSYAVLSGLGTGKRLLNIRATAQTLWLAGRIRTGNEPGSWDGWVQSIEASTGQARSEHLVDVQGGDMFWDLAPLGDGSLLAVGSTNYTQNPSGLSVSDARDNLAVSVGPDGAVRQRVSLPAGPGGRGNEVTSVRVIDGSGNVRRPEERAWHARRGVLGCLPEPAAAPLGVIQPLGLAPLRVCRSALEQTVQDGQVRLRLLQSVPCVVAPAGARGELPPSHVSAEGEHLELAPEPGFVASMENGGGCRRAWSDGQPGIRAGTHPSSL